LTCGKVVTEKESSEHIHLVANKSTNDTLPRLLHYVAFKEEKEEKEEDSPFIREMSECSEEFKKWKEEVLDKTDSKNLTVKKLHDLSDEYSKFQIMGYCAYCLECKKVVTVKEDHHHHIKDNKKEDKLPSDLICYIVSDKSKESPFIKRLKPKNAEHAEEFEKLKEELDKVTVEDLTKEKLDELSEKCYKYQIKEYCAYCLTCRRVVTEKEPGHIHLMAKKEPEHFHLMANKSANNTLPRLLHYIAFKDEDTPFIQKLMHKKGFKEWKKKLDTISITDLVTKPEMIKLFVEECWYFEMLEEEEEEEK